MSNVGAKCDIYHTTLACHQYGHVCTYRMDRNFRGALFADQWPFAKSIICKDQHCLLSYGVKMAGGTQVAQVRAPLLH